MSKTTENAMEFKAQKLKKSHERLVEFLYLLMRDHLPTGVVCKLIMDVDEEKEIDKSEAIGSPFVDGFGLAGELLISEGLWPPFSSTEFTNPHLEAMARDYAGRIKDD